jgi:hypothetical protein
MKLLLRTTDRALVESLRIQLEAEGIAVVLDPEASGTALPFIPVAILVPDSDFQQALEIARELVPAPVHGTSERTPSNRLLRGALLVIVLLAIVLCGTILVG